MRRAACHAFWLLSLLPLGGCGVFRHVNVTPLATTSQRPSNVGAYVAVTDGDQALTELSPSSFRVYENEQLVPADQTQLALLDVSSVAARHGGGPGAYLYAGAKGFVSTATRGLAKELALENIRVNAVAPGVIQTPFHDRFSTPQMLESFRGTIPMGRIGEPDECVGAFLYLASPQLSGYVTGQILEVNGGQYMP